MYIHIKQHYETKHRLFVGNVRLGVSSSLKLPASVQASYPEFQVTSRSVKQQEEVYWGFFRYVNPRATHSALYLPIHICSLQVFFHDIIKSSPLEYYLGFRKQGKWSTFAFWEYGRLGTTCMLHGQKLLHRQSRALRNAVLQNKSPVRHFSEHFNLTYSRWLSTPMCELWFKNSLLRVSFLMHITGCVEKRTSKTKVQFPAMLRRVESSVVIEVSKNRIVLLFPFLLNYILYCIVLYIISYIVSYIVSYIISYIMYHIIPYIILY